MKILGLIPARGGSKGIPGKNIKLLGGKPLLHYSIMSAKASTNLCRVILSSDNPEIIAVGKELGLESPFVRPRSLAEDGTSSVDVITHVLKELESQGQEYDAVCLLQPTTPLRRNKLIDEAVTRFICGKFDSLITVRQVPEEFNPHWVFEEEKGSLKIATGEEKIITRRQDLPMAWHRDGAIYITKTEVLLQQNSLFGKKIGFIDTTADPYVNIDTPADWQKAENLIKQIK